MGIKELLEEERRKQAMMNPEQFGSQQLNDMHEAPMQQPYGEPMMSQEQLLATPQIPVASEDDMPYEMKVKLLRAFGISDEEIQMKLGNGQGAGQSLMGVSQ